MDAKIELLDLNCLYFDTKHHKFGWCNSHGLQTALYYEVTSYLRSFVCFVLHRNFFCYGPSYWSRASRDQLTTNQKTGLIWRWYDGAAVYAAVSQSQQLTEKCGKMVSQSWVSKSIIIYLEVAALAAHGYSNKLWRSQCAGSWQRVFGDVIIWGPWRQEGLKKKILNILFVYSRFRGLYLL